MAESIIELRTDVKAKGGSLTLRRLHAFHECTWREALEGDRGGCRLVLAADNPAVADAAIGNVLRCADVYPGLTHPASAAVLDITREYRINDLKDDPNSPYVEVLAQPVVTDLGRAVVSQLAGGVRMYNVSVAFLTPAQIVTAYLIPALTAAGLTWVASGTVNGAALSLSWQQQTVLGVMLLLEEATGLEFTFTRSLTDANYTLNLMAPTIDGIDSRPVAFVGRNVNALERRIVADQRFYTRAIPQGATSPDELEPSHVGQATFSLTGVAGDTLTIDNPASADDPIGFDDQLNALTGVVSLDPPPFGRNAHDSTDGFAYDHTRHRLVVAGKLINSAGERLWWHDLDDGTSDAVDLGLSDQRGIAYATSSDSFYVANRSGGTLVVRSGASLAAVTTIAVTGGTNPNRVVYHPAWDRITVTHDSGIDVINPNTNTVLGTIGSATNNDFCLRDAASTRVLTFKGGQPTGNIYNSATLAFIANWGSPATTNFRSAGRIDISGGDQSTIYCIGDDTGAGVPVGFTITPSTNVTSGKTVLPTSAGTAHLGGRMQWSRASSAFVALSDTIAFLLSAAWAFVATTPIAFVDSTVDGWHLDDHNLGDTDFLFLPDALAHVTRVLQVPQLAAWMKFTVSDSTASSSQVVRVAGAKGLYVVGQRLEFRADSALSYRPVIDDPASIALYGQIDGLAVSESLIAKRNYLRHGTQNEWLSDRSPKYLNMVGETTLSDYEYRWDAALQSPMNPASGLTNGAYAATATTIAIDGFAAAQEFQPGDILSRSNTNPFAPGNYVVVRKHTTADGAGAVASLPISANGFAALADNTPVYLYSPNVTAAVVGGLPTASLAVLYPHTANTGVFPSLYGMASVPYLAGASVCWAVARLLVRCLNGTPSVLALAASTTGADFSSHEVSIADTGSYSDGALRAYTLAQRVDLTGGSHVALRLRATAAAAGIVAYVQSLAILNAAGAIIDRDVPYSDASALWAFGNRALRDAHSPAVNYQVQAVEDDTESVNGVGLLQLGKTLTLRDPARGINASPRIVEVTRSAVNAGRRWRQPVLTLANRPPSAVESLVAAER